MCVNTYDALHKYPKQEFLYFDCADTTCILKIMFPSLLQTTFVTTSCPFSEHVMS